MRLLGLMECFCNGLVQCVPLFALGVEGRCDNSRGRWANIVNCKQCVIRQRQLPVLQPGRTAVLGQGL